MRSVALAFVGVLVAGGCGGSGTGADATSEGSSGADAMDDAGTTAPPMTTSAATSGGMTASGGGTDDSGSGSGEPGAPGVVELFSFQGSVAELACDSDYVYASLSILDEGSQIRRVAADASAAPEVIASGNGYTDLAVEAGNLLYLSGNEVFSWDGATSTSLVSFPTSGASLTFDFDETDFWVASGTSNLSASFGWVQVPRDGSEVTNFGTQMAGGDELPYNLHLTSTHIAWSRAKFGASPSSPDLWWVSRAGGDATQYPLPAGQAVTGFDVLGDVLYFVVSVNQGLDLIQRMEVGGTPSTVLEVGAMASGGLYVDAQHLYYSTYDGALWRAPLDGSDPIAVKDDVLQTTRIDGCDAYVVFDATDGAATRSIYSVPKP